MRIKNKINLLLVFVLLAALLVPIFSPTRVNSYQTPEGISFITLKEVHLSAKEILIKGSFYMRQKRALKKQKLHSSHKKDDTEVAGKTLNVFTFNVIANSVFAIGFTRTWQNKIIRFVSNVFQEKIYNLHYRFVL